MQLGLGMRSMGTEAMDEHDCTSVYMPPKRIHLHAAHHSSERSFVSA